MTAADTTAAPGAAGGTAPALAVEHMDVTYRVRGQDRRALRNVSFEIGHGESYGLVGESGSGKSTVALALTRYLPRNGRVSAGTISINGMDPLAMGSAALRDLRAHTVSMVYQEPGRALNPSIKVGHQVAEVYEIAGLDRKAALARAEDMLRKVQISDPARVMERYPHQLSGGMAQRVVIAMALAAEPSLLILDEPTTALDATVEAEVLDLVAALREEYATSVLFISHNLAVIAKMCDRVGVLYAGELIEEGPAREVFAQPRHPYTVGLLRCIPRGGQRKDHGRLDTIPGFLPTPGDEPTGCIFAPRCPIAEERCREAPPPAFVTGPDRTSRCYLHDETADLPRNTPVDLETSFTTRRPRAGRAARAAVEDVRPARRGGQGPGRGEPQPGRGRDARAGRRVRQRQDHPGPRAARPDPAGPGLGDRPRRPAAAGRRPAPHAATSSRRCRSCSRIRTRRSTGGTRSGA